MKAAQGAPTVRMKEEGALHAGNMMQGCRHPAEQPLPGPKQGVKNAGAGGDEQRACGHGGVARRCSARAGFAQPGASC
jgi:hypothetical protein